MSKKEKKEGKYVKFINDYKLLLLEYADNKIELAKLQTVEKVALITGNIFIFAMLLFVACFVMLFLSAVLFVIIQQYLNNSLYALLVMVAFFVLLFLVLLLFKKNIINKTASMVIKYLLSNENSQSQDRKS